jgi:cell wall-associated NlpC family hydrolase
MPLDRAAIVQCARGYLGTPFAHQGRTKGVAIDCAGLLVCVAHELGLSQADVDGYGRQPDLQVFRSTLREHLGEKAFVDVQLGDILTFATPREQHLGIVAGLDPLSIVHAWEGAGRVVEHVLDQAWRRRVRGCFSFSEGA